MCAVVGGEALGQVRAIKKAGERPPWSHRDPERKPFPFEAPFHPAEVAVELYQAYSTFALRDVARRAAPRAGRRRAPAGARRPVRADDQGRRHQPARLVPARVDQHRSLIDVIDREPDGRLSLHQAPGGGDGRRPGRRGRHRVGRGRRSPGRPRGPAGPPPGLGVGDRPGLRRRARRALAVARHGLGVRAGADLGRRGHRRHRPRRPLLLLPLVGAVRPRCPRPPAPTTGPRRSPSPAACPTPAAQGRATCSRRWRPWPTGWSTIVAASGW